MVVIDWLQTCEFVRENSERFVLYCLCGCFIGIMIILLTIILVLIIENYHQKRSYNVEMKSEYQSPRTDVEYDDVLQTTRSILPIYRYDSRTQNGFYHV